MVVLPLSSSCWRVSTVTGAGVVRSLRRTRDPVTRISSSPVRLPESSAAGAGTGVPGGAPADPGSAVWGIACWNSASGGAGVRGLAGACAEAIPPAQRNDKDAHDNPKRFGLGLM